ncbi:MAG: sigma-70 family RNA polymerase sigma factor [Ruminococcaceae bacterium]|jgi:RNA polymerase sigma-70 factor (ECF subfamily)|nr:sigma-70 family RNA polymerase sigma factor [Oscillospiraceae bacterium]
MTAAEQERLYTEYHDRVLGYIRARVSNREDAEDLCAEVFEKALRASDGYDAARAAQGTWIYAITRNAVIDHFRAARPRCELPEDLSDDALPEDGLLQTELLDSLAAALEELPDELTDIIVLRYYDRLPLTEIALRLGMSYGAVKLRHQKALALLKRKLADP